jgi:CHASE2 domain-containing sensor protein
MKDWWRRHRSRLLQLWGVGIACSLLVTAASAMGYLEFLQVPTLDLMMSLQGQRFASAVVIVAIDDAAFESARRRQPLPRVYLGQLLHGLRRCGAAVVGLDVALTSPTTSRPTEVSIELPELGHGLFTSYLAQGLKGVADLNCDGIVSLCQDFSCP